MQNTPQTFRGAGAPGVNFSEHSYDNHIGAHCQPSGYQPYPNQPYHPLPSPRPHHYGNHQMQQNMPYRHHGGAYAPNQNQYGSNMNQDMYRNHSGYVGANNRNMSSKPWTDNNSSAEMMGPYGQVSHSQMMNNPPSQMPVSTMRSPPHATSNMNPTPPQGQQHYRQMQSPAHSPHSWSQAQIPSPGVMHSSRTTPSPLPTHVRSPGHSQPFSPPTAHALNMQPHPQQPENGQMPQPMNSPAATDSQNPSNPLHSLQKMVMLDQDSKAVMSIMADGSEQYANHCGPHNYVPEESVNTETKDSVYSTYYNMDENRFESKPSGSNNNNNSYSALQQVPNCNFPVPPHMVNSEEVQNSPALPNNSSVPDCMQPDQSLLTSQAKNSIPSVSHSQINQNAIPNDCATPLSECPPHAESAPVFTDQTKAAVSTNSEQALESKSELLVKSEVDNVQPTELPNLCNDETSESSELENISDKIEKSVDISQNPLVKTDENEQIIPSDDKSNIQNSESTDDLDNSNNNQPSEDKISSQSKMDSFDGLSDPSIVIPSPEVSNLKTESSSEPETSSKQDVLIKEDISDDCNVVNLLDGQKAETSHDEVVSPKNNQKEEVSDGSQHSSSDCDTKRSDMKCESPEDSSNSVEELDRNPVKVIIHRVRKDNANDSWHVPNSSKDDEDSCISIIETNNDKKTDSKIPHVGPQIVILSPAKPERKFGFQSTVNENSITVKREDNDDSECSIILERTHSNDSIKSIKRDSVSANSSSNRSPNKKRGRPMGAKNKSKPGPGGSGKRKKGKRNKKKKLDNSKQKNLEILSKIKKLKVFNGPYVHIIGSKESPSSISVVNVAQKEEEKVNKVSTKRNFATPTNRIKKKPVGHLSTLSPTYDAFNRDKTWLCIFCHKGSHYGGLGDLYGPYYIRDKNYDSTKQPSPSTSGSVRSKKRKSEHDERASKKTKQTAGHSAASTPISKNSEKDAPETDEHLKETWIHEDCAVWCQSISLMGEEVQGLEEAVTEAYENKCCKCSLTGATLGCWGKGCKELYHYSCAKETGCQMDIEKFALLCPKHQVKLDV